MSARGGRLALKNGQRYMFVNAKAWWFSAFAKIGRKTGRSMTAVVDDALVEYLASNGYTGPNATTPSRPELLDACRTMLVELKRLLASLSWHESNRSATA